MRNRLVLRVIVVVAGVMGLLLGVAIALLQTTTTGEAIDWLILKMRSTGGSLAFEDRSQNALVRLPLWDLAVDGSRLTGEQEIQFKTRQAGEVRYNGKILTGENIDVQAALKQRNEALDVRRAQLSSSVVDVEIRGTVENLNDPRLDLAIISNIHLKPASQYLSVAQKIEGDLHVDASVKGRPKELKAAGHLKSENLTAEMIGQIALDADVVYDFAGQRARLNSFRARSPDLSVSGAADVALALNAGESSVDVRLDVAELANISKMLKLPVTVASRATGNAQLRREVSTS